MQDLDDRLPEAVVEDDRLDGHADVGVDRDDGGNLLQLAQGLPLEAWRSTSHVAWGLAEGGGRVNMCIRLCILCVFARGLDTQCILCIWTPQPVYCPSRSRTEQVPTYFGQPALPTYRTTFHGPRTATPAARAQPHPLCG